MNVTLDRKLQLLVRDLERSSKLQPQAYRVGVAALALLGYAYIFFILLLLLGLLGGLIWGTVWLFKAAGTFSYNLIRFVEVLIPVYLGLLSLIGLIGRSLRVHFAPPPGQPLERHSAPRLFAMLDEVCGTLKAPRFHHVLLDNDFNAGIMQVPRLGLLGWQTNYLVIGMPLMLALSPAQFRAVIAHEVGHLSGNHGRFGAWIYRVRRTWFQLLYNLVATQHGALSVLVPFFRWYAPYFAAYTFVLARAQEYVADRCAADVCGTEGAAQALIAVEVKGRYFAGEFWSRLLKQAGTQREPPQNLIGVLTQAFQTDLSPADAQQWYEQSLEEPTGLDDTHPALRDRLAALGFRSAPGGPLDLPQSPLPVPPPATETAGQAYLGAALPRYAAMMERPWREKFGAVWREAYQETQAASRRLDELDRSASQGALPAGDLWEHARLTARFHGNAAAVPLLRRFVTAQPRHVQANYILGHILLAQNDPAGVSHLQAAAQADPQSRAPALHEIGQFLLRQGRKAEAAQYLHQARQARTAPPEARPGPAPRRG